MEFDPKVAEAPVVVPGGERKRMIANEMEKEGLIKRPPDGFN